MDNGPRKATDIILSLEQEVKKLTAMVSSQDLLLKVINNKLTELLGSSSKSEGQRIIVEAVNTFSKSNIPDPQKQILVSSEDSLQEEQSPKGFRRTSRPETFAGDDAFLKQQPKKKEIPTNFPVQIPKANGQAEIVVPNIATDVSKPVVKNQEPKLTQKQTSGNSVPTMQRIVDRNGKSVFLADIEIINLATVETFIKTRTNGTGKWQASLPIGEYKIIVKKLESLTKEKVEVSQNIVVDGTQSPLDLPMMIIK